VIAIVCGQAHYWAHTHTMNSSSSGPFRCLLLALLFFFPQPLMAAPKQKIKDSNLGPAD